MVYDQDLQRIINTQMSVTFQTLSVLSQSMTLLSAQQSSLSRMFTAIQREQQNNVNPEPPITLSFNAVTLSDLYDLSSNEIPITLNTNDPNPILQHILNNFLNMNTDTSANEGQSNPNIVTDVSQVTEEMCFSDINDPTTTICPISLENFEPNDPILRINRCQHYFKKNSLLYWFRLSRLCPVCRGDVTLH